MLLIFFYDIVVINDVIVNANVMVSNVDDINVIVDVINLVVIFIGNVDDLDVFNFHWY